MPARNTTQPRTIIGSAVRGPGPRGVRATGAPVVAALFALLWLCAPRIALAQQQLNWNPLEVSARLDAAGRLHVTETQTIVFTGYWNGGERRFDIRPQQRLSFTRISRTDDGAARGLTENPNLDNIDDFAWIDARTLRWRSRLASDPPFAHTPITYTLEYTLSGVISTSGDGYLLDHDFAFPDRVGPIDSFVLRLELDPVWHALTEVRPVYEASSLAPGKSFVLTIPLRYTGAERPEARRSATLAVIAVAVALVLGGAALGMLAFIRREDANGRFAPVTTDQIDAAWIAEHVLKYPAEVVGAAWDDSIGTPEVVALLARLVNEGALESAVIEAGGDNGAMSLRLKVDRSTLDGHARTLVDALFFEGRSETSTADIRAHYHDAGFDPAQAIRRELEDRVRQLFGDAGEPPIGVVGLVWFLTCIGLLALTWYLGNTDGGLAVKVGGGALFAAGAARAAGMLFRSQMDVGRRAALVCFVPAMMVAARTAAFFWFDTGPGSFALDPLMLVATIGLSLWVTYSTIRGMTSRTSRAGIAIRKNLIAARRYFSAELEREQPNLRNEWYPWVLAFGLGPQLDAWSATRASAPSSERIHGSYGVEQSSNLAQSSSSNVTPSSSSSSEAWTGFGGGRSGGAGATAGWSMAAAGMAATIAPPTSTSSGGDGSWGSSSVGSFGGDSGGGSSGGGGGGGW